MICVGYRGKKLVDCFKVFVKVQNVLCLLVSVHFYSQGTRGEKSFCRLFLLASFFAINNSNKFSQFPVLTDIISQLNFNIGLSRGFEENQMRVIFRGNSKVFGLWNGYRRITSLL